MGLYGVWPHECSAQRGQKGTQIPRSWSYSQLSAVLHWYWEPTSTKLQEQVYMLLTTKPYPRPSDVAKTDFKVVIPLPLPYWHELLQPALSFCLPIW